MHSIVIDKGIVTPKTWKIFTLLLCFHVSAPCLFAQTITLNLKEQPIEKAFKTIEEQTAFRFIYSKESIQNARPVTVQVNKVSLKEALEKLFSDQPLHYSVEDAYIMVRAKNETTSPSIFDLTGHVSDEQGTALQGVSIIVKGTSKGTRSDENGRFGLRAIDPGDVLVFSIVGYRQTEIPVAGNKVLNVQMPVSVSLLDETVIKGYYTTSRRLNTGTVVKITSEQIGRQPVSNPLAALQGQVPGLFITQRNGMGSSDFDVLIRGKNSIQNGTEPLYVIDGVPFPSGRMTQLSLFSAGNAFNSLNPADIESIEVLKDADATAIYGSRGANGVILITTKKGVAGKTKLEGDVSLGWGRVMDRLTFMNSAQYISMRREAFTNDGVVPTNANARDLLAWGDTTRYTDWKKWIIGNTARITNARIAFSGGNELVRFLADAAWYKQTTVFPGSFAGDRKTFNLGITGSSTDKKFTCQLSTGFGIDNSNLPQQDLTYLLTIPPNTPGLRDSLGKLLFSKNGFGFTNPSAIMLQTYTVATERLTANLLLSYRLLPGLVIKTSLGYNQNRSTETSIQPVASQNPVLNPKGSSSFGSSEIKTWIAEPQVEYSRAIGSGLRIQLLGGATLQQNHSDYSLITATGYTNDNLLNSTVGAASTTSKVGNSEYHYEALYSRFGLDFQKKYLLNLTARRDGSSRFGPGRQFANFGAVGMGWIFSEEKALRTSSVLSFGKLRGSFGITGNQPLNDYQYLDTWSGTTYPYGGQSGLQPSRIANADYHWEEIRKLELALDLGFINDRVLLSPSWFRNRSSNQIVSWSLPAQTGFSTVTKNFPGIVQNTGFEMTLTTKNIMRSAVEWTTAINFTWSRNRLVSFPGLSSSSYANNYEIGRPLDILRGYHYLGVNSQTGIYNFEDRNKDNALNTLDYQYIGTRNPSWYGGVSNSIHFSNFRFDCLFQLVKQEGLDPVFASNSASGTQLNNRPDLVLDHWQKPGDVARYERYTQNFGGAAYTASLNVATSDAILVDASYVRLKNVSLSWSLPATAMRRMKLGSVAIYAEAQNLLTFTKYKGPDPEVQNPQTLPPLRIFVTGIKFSL